LVFLGKRRKEKERAVLMGTGGLSKTELAICFEVGDMSTEEGWILFHRSLIG
jgi:hypothetical protein